MYSVYVGGTTLYLQQDSVTSVFRRPTCLGSLFLLINKARFIFFLITLDSPVVCLIVVDTPKVSGLDVANISTWMQLLEEKQTVPLTEKNIHVLKNQDILAVGLS